VWHRRTQVVTFIDLAGHEKYLKTTVFGLTGCAPEFAMLMVRPEAPAPTREHLHADQMSWGWADWRQQWRDRHDQRYVWTLDGDGIAACLTAVGYRAPGPRPRAECARLHRHHQDRHVPAQRPAGTSHRLASPVRGAAPSNARCMRRGGGWERRQETVKQITKILKSPGCRKVPLFLQTMDDVIETAGTFVADKYVRRAFGPSALRPTPV
jgi:hypothetical protein